MDARGCGGRLGEAVATEGVRSAAAPVGSGTLFCLDWPQPQDEQGLREAMCKWGSVRICCHESPHGEAFGSLMRLFHTVSEEEFSEVRSGLNQSPSYLWVTEGGPGDQHGNKRRRTRGAEGSRAPRYSGRSRFPFAHRCLALPAPRRQPRGGTHEQLRCRSLRFPFYCR